MHVQYKLSEARMAVMHVLIAAHRRYVDAGESFGPLPAGCIDLRSTIASDSDPRLEMIDRFVSENITTDLVRGPGQRGLKVLGFLRRDDIIRHIHSSGVGAALFSDVKAWAMKDLVTGVMSARGMPMTPNTA